VKRLSALYNEEDSGFAMLQTRPGRASTRAGRGKRLQLPGNGLPKSQDLFSRVSPANCLIITTRSVNGQSIRKNPTRLASRSRVPLCRSFCWDFK